MFNLREWTNTALIAAMLTTIYWWFDVKLDGVNVVVAWSIFATLVAVWIVRNLMRKQTT